VIRKKGEDPKEKKKGKNLNEAKQEKRHNLVSKKL
jgi:hypothetical protein